MLHPLSLPAPFSPSLSAATAARRGSKDRRPRRPSSPSRLRPRVPRCEPPHALLSLPDLLLWCLVASCGRFACAREAFAAGHGFRRFNLPLRPSSRPRCVCENPCYFPVLSVLRTVARRPLTARAGDLHAAGHGACRRCHCSGLHLLLSHFPDLI